MSNIYSIKSALPFLDTLAQAILNGQLFEKSQLGPDLLNLPNMTLLLPTRRAARAMQEAFLRVSGKDALLIPRIRPIGEVDEDFNQLASGDLFLSGGQVDDMDPPISHEERHLVLTQMVGRWLEMNGGAPQEISETILAGRRQSNSAAEASLLARDLARLLDEAAMENVDLQDLKTLVPDSFSRHWQQNLDFLSIIIDAWPAYLTAAKLSSPGVWRNAALLKEAQHLRDHPPKYPIIAAGSTGTIPAASELMRAIYDLPNGAIVLPGVDLNLGDDTYNKIADEHPEHPQFGLAKLLRALKVDRGDILDLEPENKDKSKQDDLAQMRLERTGFLSQLMRPSNDTKAWQTYIRGDHDSALETAFKDIRLIEAVNGPEEAELVSLILRDVVRDPNKRAALITPDRILARRVAVRMEQWGLKIDDSAGRPLAKTMVGTFFDLIGAAIAQNFAPTVLLALLKHPLTQMGYEGGQIRLAARALELICLRQPLVDGGMQTIVQSYERLKAEKAQEQIRHPALKRLREEDWDLAASLIERLKQTIAAHGFFQSTPFKRRPLRELFQSHIDLAQSFAADHEGNHDHLWSGEAGEALSQLLAGFLMADVPQLAIEPIDYPDFYRSLVQGESVRPLTPVHPRVFIWGPYEARLQRLDCVVLGGLNEGSWPQGAKSDPWLSRPMRASLGMPQSEQKNGFEAHDFVGAFSAPQVYLTRAEKQDGVPTVASRWVMRMKTLLEAQGRIDLLNGHKDEAKPYLQWAKARDLVKSVPPISAPEPRPQLALRPRRLSVTQIESWIANPYSIYARHILKLEPLDPLDCPPDARLKGILLHQCMADYLDQYDLGNCPNIESVLEKALANHTSSFKDHPWINAFWRPRFAQFSKWFAQTETERIDGVNQAKSEVRGSLNINTRYKPFLLTATADRIDWAKGDVRIYDYKTGAVPTPKQVAALYSPQLPLEAAIAAQGGFDDIPQGRVTRLSYIDVKGDRTGGVESRLEHKLNVGEVAQKAVERLTAIVNQFDDEAKPYRAVVRKRFAGKARYDSYAHLARFGEWQGEVDEDEL